MAQNYTRQSSFNDGDTISASLFNDEYNQLVNSFSYSSSSESGTGHRHDGSAGQGGNIYRIGDLDFFNKIEADSTNNRWGFWVEVGGSAVEQVRIQDGAVLPVTTNDIDLGSGSLKFKDLHLSGTANIPTADINGGNIDGTVIGAATPAAGSFTTGQFGTSLNVDGTVTADGLTVDNSGTAISITNGDGLTQLGKFSGEATDGFVIEGKANNNLTLRTKANTAGEGIKFQDSAGDNMMFIDGTTGDISFYEDTGTTAKFFWDASAESLGIGTTSPTSRMTVKATGSSFADASFVLENYNTTDRTYLAHTGGKFYLSNDGSTTHMLVDASGNVGIGTPSPATRFELSGVKDTSELRLSSTTNDASWAANQYFGKLSFYSADSSGAGAGIKGSIVSACTGGSSGANAHMAFSVASTTTNEVEAMRIDSAGNVGIGTTSITNVQTPTLQLGTNRGAVAIGTGDIQDNGSTLDIGSARPISFSISGSEKARIDSSGNVGIGTTSPSFKLDVAGNARAAYFALRSNETAPAESSFIYRPDTGVLAFGTGTVERARLDASGNLLVGRTSTITFGSNTTTGAVINEDGRIDAAADGEAALILQRLNSDGNIANFYKDGTTVGSIGTASSKLTIGSGATGVRFNYASLDTIAPWNVTTNAVTDGATDLGYTNARFKDLYLSGSVKVPAASKGIEYSSTAFITPENNVTGAEISTPGAFVVKTGATPAERMRIDSSGNLLVGTTDDVVWNNSANSSADNGHNLRDDGRAGFAYYNATTGANATVNINRTGSDGDLIRLFKSGTTVGSIGSVAGQDIVIGSGSAGLRFLSTGPAIQPRNADGTANNDAIDLGLSTNRFKDLYLSGGVYLGGTGAANLLDDYEEGTWTPAYAATTTLPTLTYTHQSGDYVKVGNIVHARFRIVVNTASGSGAGILYVDLPFTAKNALGNGWAGSIGWNGSGSGWSTVPYNVVVILNTTRLYLHSMNMSTGAINDLSPAALGAGCIVEASITYEAA